MTTRREFLRTASASVALATGFVPIASCMAAPTPPLIDGVVAVCRRLAPLGWGKLLSKVTGGQLDITATDLRKELEKPLTTIDRGQPGFGDFSVDGHHAIEPGKPDLSLLYHALAAPTVVAGADGATLGGFPTLAEIEAVENYVYGCNPPSLESLRDQARALAGADATGGKKGKIGAKNGALGIVVYALEYRNAPESVHGCCAELCFARTGIARLGNKEPLYDAQARAFSSLDPTDASVFRAVPQRFAAYLSVQVKGKRDSFGPQDALAEDSDHRFWVPLHKLFNGDECVKGMTLDLRLTRNLRNEKLRQFQISLNLNGIPGPWSDAQLNEFPFVIRDEQIASMSQRPEFGAGVLEPPPHPLAEQAARPGEGTPLVFDVPPAPDYPAPLSLYWSSLQILPTTADTEPAYAYGMARDTQRPAPEYVNIRHRYKDNGIDVLSRRPDMMKIIQAGDYKAVHYIDYAGDGWIDVHCVALADEVGARVPAYALVAPPDFFPQVSQRELTQWWRNEVPMGIRNGLWALPPLPLSQARMAANITLPVGFSITDKTVTAIVSQPGRGTGIKQVATGPNANRSAGLPDSSPGVFDPGWDASQGIYYSDPDEPPIQRFLQSYGLGTPFVEDIKLCAALGNYWPGVAPDNTRTFAPNKSASTDMTFAYTWPTSTPLTDEETGILPMASGEYRPWDGVRGPQYTGAGQDARVVYTGIYHVDYLDLPGKMTASLTAKIDLAEYKARTLAMAAVYWALGIRDRDYLDPGMDDEAREKGLIALLKAKSGWAVLSFRAMDRNDKELAEAWTQAKATRPMPSDGARYRFQLYLPDKQEEDVQKFEVGMSVKEMVIAYTIGSAVLFCRGDGPWTIDASIPT